MTEINKGEVASNSRDAELHLRYVKDLFRGHRGATLAATALREALETTNSAVVPPDGASLSVRYMYDQMAIQGRYYPGSHHGDSPNMTNGREVPVGPDTPHYLASMVVVANEDRIYAVALDGVDCRDFILGSDALDVVPLPPPDNPEPAAL